LPLPRTHAGSVCAGNPARWHHTEESTMKSHVRACLFALVLALLASPPAGAGGGGKDWYSAWGTSHNSAQVTPSMSGRTVRMLLMPSISGTHARVKIENTMGTSPVTFSAAYLGVSVGDSAEVQAGTNRQLTFDGQAGLTLAPGEGAYSDAIKFRVRAFEKVSLSLDVESAVDISSHVVGLRINYSAPGPRGADVSGTGYEPLPEIPALNSGQWPFYWVAGLDVKSESTSGSIILFGDSITDGRCSTRDDALVVQPNLYQRWGDVLARRLARGPEKDRKAVVNEGIAGNRILNRGNGPSALERVHRDVLDRDGATHVVFFEGTNDIAGGFTAAEIQAGAQIIIDKAHAAGLKIIGVTAIPRGRPAPLTGWTSSQEAQRLLVNEWIRKQANFDGVIDFDKLMRHGPVVTLADGGTAKQIPAEWNCDNTHPNAAGYKAMGEYIDLRLFRSKDRDDDHHGQHHSHGRHHDRH
jgi:lysophospholipase L1-like esterase